MFIGLLRNATARQRRDDAPVLPYPHAQTIDQALANLQTYEPAEDQDADVRRAVKRQRKGGRRHV